MRAPTYFILAALMDGPLHGYMIIKRVEELSAHRVRLATGTLYAALDRLTGEHLIQVTNEETVNGRARRYYGLTDAGAAAAHSEAVRMAEDAQVILGRRTSRPWTPGLGTTSLETVGPEMVGLA